MRFLLFLLIPSLVLAQQNAPHQKNIPITVIVSDTEGGYDRDTALTMVDAALRFLGPAIGRNLFVSSVFETRDNLQADETDASRNQQVGFFASWIKDNVPAPERGDYFLVVTGPILSTAGHYGTSGRSGAICSWKHPSIRSRTSVANLLPMFASFTGTKAAITVIMHELLHLMGAVHTTDAHGPNLMQANALYYANQFPLAGLPVLRTSVIETERCIRYGTRHKRVRF